VRGRGEHRSANDQHQCLGVKGYPYSSEVQQRLSKAERFRAELGVDDASWLRGRGLALYQAVMALAYYWDTNPGMVRQASHALEQVLACY
jgi:hypothetical protein